MHSLSECQSTKGLICTCVFKKKLFIYFGGFFWPSPFSLTLEDTGGAQHYLDFVSFENTNEEASRWVLVRELLSQVFNVKDLEMCSIVPGNQKKEASFSL